MSGKRRKQVVSVDSPFSGFLETDRIPSLQETRAIKEILAEKTAHLARLNSKVPRRRSGKKIPALLRSELDLTRRFIKFHQALIAPWRRLPTEIMAEIFTFTLNPVSVHDVEFWDDGRSFVLRLCKICRNWRQIAISTPALWTVLYLHLPGSQSSFDWVSLWLDRSRSLPIYLQVLWDDTASPTDISVVLSVFASHIHHTASLLINGLNVNDVELGPSYPKATFPLMQSIDAPLLTTLEAYLPPDSKWDWILSACQSAPRLTTLHTVQYSPDWFPVSQLTKLHVGDPVPMAEFLQILQNAPCLEDVSIDLDGPSAPSPTGDIMVVKTLSKLEISSGEHLGEFFDWVSLPNLVDIEVSLIISWPEEKFLSLLSRSSCSLKALDLSEVEISPEQIVTCLRHKACDTLELLAVSDCSQYFTADGLVSYLTYRQPSFPHPKLQAIELFDVHIQDGLLADLAESRILPVADLPSDVAPPGRLKKFHFSLIEGPVLGKLTHPKDWRRLEELQRIFGDETQLLWKDED